MQLSEQPKILDLCPIEIKRQVWEDLPRILNLTLQHLLKDFSDSCTHKALTIDELRLRGPVSRLRGTTVTSVLNLIGQSTKLYDSFLVSLRSYFLKTMAPIYCTLRADVLMALHEAQISVLCVYI